jgi:hypothetical protein
MTQYLISFDDGAMSFPEEDLPEVTKAAHEVVVEAQAAGVWVFGGASWPPTGWSPTARTRRPRRSSAGSRLLRCPHAQRRWSGRPRSRSPAAVRRRYGSSCPTRPSDRVGTRGARTDSPGYTRVLTLDRRKAVGYVVYSRRLIGTGQGMRQIPSVADGLLRGTAAGDEVALEVGSRRGLRGWRMTASGPSRSGHQRVSTPRAENAGSAAAPTGSRTERSPAVSTRSTWARVTSSRSIACPRRPSRWPDA